MLWSERVVVELASLYESSFRLAGLTADEGLSLLGLSVLLGIGAAWFSWFTATSGKLNPVRFFKSGSLMSVRQARSVIIFAELFPILTL